MQSLRDSEADFAEYDVTYFMASVDSVADNKRFAKQQKANFPLLCDTNKNITQLYGVGVNYGGNVLSKRWTIYINKAGVVKKIDKQVNPRSAGPDMLRSFESLGFAKR